MGIKEVIVKKSRWDTFSTKNQPPKAMKINPKDDAFHGSFNFLDIEWWYFDAIFENGYSVHVGVRTFHTKHHGVVKLRIELYTEGKTLVEALQSDLFERFHFFRDVPQVNYRKDTLIAFDQDYYQKTGLMRYHVRLHIDAHAVDLVFTGGVQGWKIETPDNSWVVALPTAEVTGTLTINHQQIPVKGVGYHDHNWDYSISTAIKNQGWYWGRLTGELFNIIWANTIQNPHTSSLLAVVSQKQQHATSEQEFFTVPQQHLSLTAKNFIMDHRRRIPTEFEFQITEHTSATGTPIKAHLLMKTKDVQHSRIFTAHYWRYHMLTTGTLEIGSKKETFTNSPQIVEFLSFKQRKKTNK